MKPDAPRQRGAHAPRGPLSAPPPNARAGCAAPSASSGAGTGDAGGEGASRHTRGRVCSPKAFLAVALLCAWPVWAQLSWTNSATLTVLQSASNVVLRAEFATTNGAFNLLQADRLDRLHLPPHAHQLSNQIYDLNWVPAGRQMEWTLTNAPDSAPRFFRLLLEPVLSRGRVWAFPNGPIDYTQPVDWDNPTYVKPTEAWIDNLGEYDLEGNLIGSNKGRLTGFYVSTLTGKFLGTTSSVERLYSAVNDFRVDYATENQSRMGQSLAQAGEAQLYWAVNDYRNRFMNAAFIKELQLPSELEKNILLRQHRPDLLTWKGERVEPRRANVNSKEDRSLDTPLFFDPKWNRLSAVYRSPYFPENTGLPIGLSFDPSPVVADFAGLMSLWVLGTNKCQPPDSAWGGATWWYQNVVPALNDGLSAWVEYRYSESLETSQNYYAALRRWNKRTCGLNPQDPNVNPKHTIPCLRGVTARNVMMYDRNDFSLDSIVPFYERPSSQRPDGTWERVTTYDGPVQGGATGLYFAAIFYDIANEAGLGVHRADLLIWKTFSLIQNSDVFSMEEFGATVLAAAEALWGERYTADVAEVLRSRGISLPVLPNGEDDQGDFRRNLPRPVGGVFGSAHPEPHPSTSHYGAVVVGSGAYEPATTEGYVAYQFHKHSKYGPCDRLVVTDGTFDVQPDLSWGHPGSGPSYAQWSYRNDGTYYTELQDRELGNLVLLAPAGNIRWLRSLQRCRSEAEGFFPEDVKPFGFRVIAAVPNGFSFTVQRLGESATNHTYRLSIVDPSLTSLGPATYVWSVTDHLDTMNLTSGDETAITVARDEPFTLAITRTRGETVDTLTWRERGNDLDRNGGQAFVRNLVPP